MKTYLFSPLDTWFFRDGRPYNQNELNQVEISSIFPPPVTGMVGGMRSALAMNQGWSGRGDWPKKIKDILGDRADLGGLRFIGPNLFLDNSPVFPAPSILLGHSEYFITRLRPGLPLRCDLGNVRLPVAEQPHDGLKELTNKWLTVNGMQQVLAGEVPDIQEIMASSSLWSHENRVGIERNYSSRVVKEGMLYSTGHIRLNKNVNVALSVSGLPDGWEPVTPSGFGGEGRMTWIEPYSGGLPLPVAQATPARDGYLRYIVVLSTPADLPVWPTQGDVLPGLPGHIVLGCIGRPLRLGGWDSLDRKPTPLKPLIPAGSVWFMETEANMVEQVKALHGAHIGQRTEWGFGQIFIGTWKEENQS